MHDVIKYCHSPECEIGNKWGFFKTFPQLFVNFPGIFLTAVKILYFQVFLKRQVVTLSSAHVISLHADRHCGNSK